MSVMNTGGIFDGFDFEAQGIDPDIYGSMNQPMNPLDAGSVMGLDGEVLILMIGIWVNILPVVVVMGVELLLISLKEVETG
jgi:hypothetical protein